MHIAILGPSDRSYTINHLDNYSLEMLPTGIMGAPFIGIIINELLNSGHKVTAITTSVAISNDYEIRKFYNGNFTWVVVPSRPRSFAMNGWKVGRIVDLYGYEQQRLKECIIESNADFVHAHWSYEFAGAALKSGLPCLVTVHDNAFKVLRYFKNGYRFGRLLLSEIILRKVRFASTVSPYMIPYIKRHCNATKLISNPVVIGTTKSDLELLIDLRCNSLLAPKLIMINNGWNSLKNGKVVLQAFEKLLQKIPAATLHLYGDGTEEGGLANKDASKIGIEKIFFHGIKPHKELLAEIKNAHLLIHPSLEESFGVVLIEAMSCGLPTVGGQKSGAVPWVINEKQLLIDVTSEDKIVNKLTEILGNVNLYKNISYSVYENVVTRFSSNFIVNEYVNYYQEIKKDW